MQAKPDDTSLTQPSDCKIFSFATLILALSLAFSSFLNASLWLDESISAWVSSEGVATAITRSWNFQGQSPLYYIILALWTKLVGHTETALRLLSLIFLGGSTILIFLWTKPITSSRSAFVACFIFICLDPVLLAICARPYALGILCSILSIRSFSRFITKSSLKTELNIANKNQNRIWIDLLFFCIWGCLAIYSHYFAALSIFAVSTIAIIALCSNRRQRLQILFSQICITTLCLPLFPHIMLLQSKSSEISFAPALTTIQTLEGFLPITIFIAALIAPLATATFLRKPIQSIFIPSSLEKTLPIIIASWWLVPPFVLFIFSLLKGSSFLIPRYLSFSSPAFAILLALGFSQIKPKLQLAIALILVGLLASREFIRTWSIEDWRGAITHASQQTRPVLFASGLAESKNIAWLASSSSQTQQYLRSPVQYYNRNLNTLTIPSSLKTDELRSYTLGIIKTQLAQSGQLLIIFLYNPEYSRELFTMLSSLDVHSSIRQSGLVSVLWLEKPQR